MRVRLTLWYVAAMVVVLGVYAVGVFAFVSRSVVARRSTSGCAATSTGRRRWSIETPDGRITLVPQVDLLLEEERPWVQVWSADGAQLLLSERRGRAPAAARRRRRSPLEPTTASSRSRAGDRAPMRRAQRGASRIGAIGKPVVIQVARSEAPMRQQLRELLLILVLGLPLAVAVAGLGGYALARRALAPIER